MNEDESYLKELEQAYINNTNDEEYFAELFAEVSYEVDCMVLSNPTPDSITLTK